MVEITEINMKYGDSLMIKLHGNGEEAICVAAHGNCLHVTGPMNSNQRKFAFRITGAELEHEE